MNSNRKIAMAAALLCAAGTTPALAQEAFQGPYVAVFGGATMVEERNGDSLAFDTDRDGEFDDQVLTGTGANAFSPGFCDGPANGSTPPCGADKYEPEYGIRAGMDFRPGGGAFLLGGLVEFGRTELKDSTSGFSTTPASYTVTREMDYAASARARAGLVAGDRALFYGTGGVSYAKIDNSFSTTNGANSFTEVNDDEMAWGWQAGGGVEVLLTERLGLGIEYLYSQYKADDHYVEVGRGTAPATNPFLLDNASGTNLRSTNDQLRTHSLRVAASYRF